MLLIHRLYIKTALIHLLLGSSFGGWMLLEQAQVVPVIQRNLYSVHIHLVGIGFFLMMVCGVALWMFPRKSGEDRITAAREPFAWVTYILLTGGLAIRSLAVLFPEIFSGNVLAASAFIQVGGILSFALSIWPRIYMPGAKIPIERKR